jgi:hypothetical protein
MKRTPLLALCAVVVLSTLSACTIVNTAPRPAVVTPPAVTATATPAPPIDGTALQSILAPAMCTRLAGNLVNGSLPVDDPTLHGSTTLATHSNGTVLFAAAQPPDDPASTVAVVFECNAGGVGWPNVIGLYDAKLHPLASIDLGDIDEQEHSNVTALAWRGGKLHVDWFTNDDGCHTGADDSVPRSADFTVAATGATTMSNSTTGESSEPCLN